MTFLLGLSRWIDGMNERIGNWVSWLSLIAVLVSSGNALMRYGIDWSSNWLLEMQWHLFAVVFMFAGAYALRHNEHVRVDIIFSRCSPKTQNFIDIFGTLVFLFPVAALMVYEGTKFFLQSYAQMETNGNPGSMWIWHIKLLIPIGFGLLLLQAISQLIKQIAFLCGKAENPMEYHEKVR